MTVDRQKTKVYRWESEFPEGAWLEFDAIEPMVRRIWAAEDLIGPPLVRLLNPNDKYQGKGSRSILSFPGKGASELTVLHEIAHAMTTMEDGCCDRHGAEFVGVYIYLLDKYLNVPSLMAWYLAAKAGLDFNRFARPWVGTEIPAAYRVHPQK